VHGSIAPGYVIELDGCIALMGLEGATCRATNPAGYRCGPDYVSESCHSPPHAAICQLRLPPAPPHAHHAYLCLLRCTAQKPPLFAGTTQPTGDGHANATAGLASAGASGRVQSPGIIIHYAFPPRWLPRLGGWVGRPHHGQHWQLQRRQLAASGHRHRNHAGPDDRPRRR
jgi:hypothetical protein